ncbi:hypothetical protein OAG34_00265 [bacterium]|jgi:Tfp pilus assembly protein PilV|nr:hypothetical protein [bacterium]
MHHQPSQKRKRTGSLIIECVIASLILASCSIALLKWTHSGNQLKQQANTHTAAVLIADNAVERLKQATIENASELANSVASELSDQQGFGVAITSSKFNSREESGPDLNGIHFTITVSQGSVPITVKHSWKLGATNDSPVGENATNDSIAPSPENREETANE